MLLRFRAANFRSIYEPIEFVFDVQRRTKTGPGEAPRVAALYGANASGKSNVLEAMSFARSAVIASHNRWGPSSPTPHDPFALLPDAVSSPSLFEFDVMLDGVRYQYGFTLGPTTVVDEWLFAYPTSRRRLLFERDDGRFDFGRGLRGPNRSIADLVRPNSLFLSAAATNNHEAIAPLYEWFNRMEFAGLRAGAPGAPTRTLELLDGEHRAEVERLLTVADLGITGVTVGREEFDPTVVSAVRTLVSTLAAAEGAEPDFEVEPMQTVVEFSHSGADGSSARISLAEESRGTQTWFSHIGPVLNALRRGSILVVDELDASLHPRLSSEILRLFSDPVTNPRAAQLLFTTHDTSLLGHLVGRGLTRDEVWLTEKDNRGATLFYPLSDFRPRTKEALERGYLRGRYGGVPIVDFTELADQLT